MNAKDSTLSKEQRFAGKTFGFFLIATITGFITYFTSTQTIWQQWTVIAHVLTGMILSFIALPYLFFHFRRTIGKRRPSVILTGLLSVIVFLLLAFSGFNFILGGSTESGHWVYDLHILTASFCLLFLVLHVMIHWFFFPARKKNRQKSKVPIFISLQSSSFIKVFLPVFATFAAILTLSFIYSTLPSPYTTEPVVADYSYEYGPNPFRPSQTETYHKKFIDINQINRSKECAACHADIAAQWQSSTHKLAASDPTYITNVSLLAENMGIAATRYCEGCHSPIALLTGQLSEGGLHGGIENTPANDEGVNCLSCHSISNVVHLNGVASYEFGQNNDYLFQSYDSAIAGFFTRFLIQVSPATHKDNMNKAPLSSPQLCATCHAQFMDEDLNDWGWVKMQDEYSAWLNSPYSQQSDLSFTNENVATCQDCHMPLVKSSDPSANESGLVKSHRFLGANTMLPHLLDDDVQLRLTQEFLQRGKIRITLEEPRRDDAVQTLLSIDESIREQNETPYYYYLGETASIKAIVTNQGVGHNFPGGTIDLNEAWLAITVTDAANNLVFQSGQLLESNEVEPKAHFYRSRPIDRNGQLVWKHDLFNRVGEASRNVIPAGQSDIVEYNFPVPDWVKNPMSITATLRYRKLNDRYARWALQDKYEALPITDMARDTIVVPIRVKPSIETLD